MKKLLPILLILLLSFSFGGYYWYFSWLVAQNQEDMEEMIGKGVPDDQLTLIIVDLNKPSPLVWKKSGKEFSLHGKWFDVVKQRTAGLKRYLFCINDTREKELFDHLYKDRNANQKTRFVMKKMITFHYLPPPSVSNKPSSLCMGIPGYQPKLPHTVCLDGTDPPPKYS